MNLYLLSQNDNYSIYNVYENVVVCAESEEEAVKIHPSGKVYPNWGRGTQLWTWASSPKAVSAKLLGVSITDNPCVICANLTEGWGTI